MNSILQIMITDGVWILILIGVGLWCINRFLELISEIQLKIRKIKKREEG